MAGVIATIPRIQFSNALGIPLAGGKLITYLAGTNTLVATFQDQALTEANPTTIPLDSTGSCVLWLDPEKSYKFLLKNKFGVVQPGWPIDNISGSSTVDSLGTQFAKYMKISAISAATGSALVGWRRANITSEMRTVADVLEEDVRITDFMNFGQRNSVWLGTLLTDCSDAAQAAVTYCLANGKNLIVPGRVRVDTEIMIDRLVDTTINEFRIKGTSANAGFWTSNPISIFSSNLLGYATREDFPGSEFTVFESIRFEASDPTINCFAVNGDKFLRMRFDRCYFRAIRCAYTLNFYQTWSFNLCNMRRWKGVFLEAATGGPSFQGLDGFGFDIRASNCIMEEGDATQSAFLKLAGQYSGGGLTDNLFEGCTGPFVECVGGQGVAASGNYFEGASGISMFKIGRSYNFQFTANRFSNGVDPTYWPIDCQDAYTVIGMGNYSDGNLYKISAMQHPRALNAAGFYNTAARGLISIGDVAYNGYVTDDPTYAQQFDKIKARYLSMGLDDFSQGDVYQLVAAMRADGVSGSIPTSAFNWYTKSGARGVCKLELRVSDALSGEFANPLVTLSNDRLKVTGFVEATQGFDLAPLTGADVPAYKRGRIYFDGGLNKLRIGGATGWETIPST